MVLDHWRTWPPDASVRTSTLADKRWPCPLIVASAGTRGAMNVRGHFLLVASVSYEASRAVSRMTWPWVTLHCSSGMALPVLVSLVRAFPR